ncbi:glutathione S-transferase [Aquirhabdus sp.]|uniref:glutathione S-transferase n=1 Tax=Aquirhabdus sp. TaxID=2824160 RepID=UPI00396C81BC
MITVHHLNNSRSLRILWLLEELGLPYEIKFYQRDPQTMLAPKSLKAIHPLGKSPVITDGEVTVAETGAIIEYLMDRYADGRLLPEKNTPDWLKYKYFLHYAEGTLMPPLVMKLVFNRIETAPMPFFIKPIAKKISQRTKSLFIQPNIDTNLDFLESELNKTLWFAGNELTAADIQMSFPLEAASARGGATSGRYPKIQALLDRIHARPAYQRALERGGEFKLG